MTVSFPPGLVQVDVAPDPQPRAELFIESAAYHLAQMFDWYTEQTHGWGWECDVRRRVASALTQRTLRLMIEEEQTQRLQEMPVTDMTNAFFGAAVSMKLEHMRAMGWEGRMSGDLSREEIARLIEAGEIESVEWSEGRPVIRWREERWPVVREVPMADGQVITVID